MRVKELIEKINIFDVNVTFDPLEEMEKDFSAGIIMPLAFSCVEGKERKKYENLRNKSEFESHSATIHVLDLTINDIVDIFQADAVGNYEITREMIAPYLQDDIPEEVGFVCFLFLHEVGHWMQFKELGCNISKYTERYIELYKANYEKGNQIWVSREKRKMRGITCELTAREKKDLIQCQREYRQIPSEKDADEFAIQHLSQILNIYRKLT